MTEDIFKAWDKLNIAIGAMLLARADQMTQAAERLENARKEYEKLFMKEALKNV